MPTKSRGFFACDYCGLQHDTLEEAIEHEQSQCARAAVRRPIGQMGAYPQQPQQSLSQQTPNYYFQQHQQHHHHHGVSGMGPLAPAPTESVESYPHAYARASPFAGYSRVPTGGSVGLDVPYLPKTMTRGGAVSSSATRCFPLASYPPERATDILTINDTMACQNVEIFETTPEIITGYERLSSSSDNRIVPKQVGLRCRNCGFGSNSTSSNPNSAAAGAIIFPDDLLSVGNTVRQIADHHLTACRQTNPDVQAACQKAASKRHRERGMVRMNEEKINDDDVDDDRASKTALLDYCEGICQRLGIRNKSNDKSGIEFTPTSSPVGTQQHHTAGGHRESSIVATPLQRRRDTTSSTRPPTVAADGAYAAYLSTPQNRPPGTSSSYGSASAQLNSGGGGIVGGSSYSISRQGHPSYVDHSASFAFYQENDRTWHCRYCSYIPHQYRDSQSIWSSSGGGPPPTSFVEQHLSICRAYRQQTLPSMPPSAGLLAPGQPAYGIMPYGNPPPSPYGMQLHGQPPNPSGSWEATAPLGGTLQSSHMQYHSIMAHQDPSYRYGQPQTLPPGIMNPHTMDPHLSGARFLSTLGQNESRSGYSERGGPIMPALPPAGTRGPSYALSHGNNTNDLMKDAMAFLANYDAEYYARDPESAAIPKLVLDEDHLLLTDYFFYLMKQLRLVRFTENDRKTRGGKREKIKIGYGGLQCIHCADLPMSRKFFWSNVDRLANSFAEIPGHVLKCRRCPQANKDALMRLKQGHPEQMSKLPRGSQKIFFRRMWRRLHEGDPQSDDIVVESPKVPRGSENPKLPVSSIKTSPEKDTKNSDEFSHSGSITVTSDETILVMQRSAKEAAKALAQSTTNNSGPPSPSSRILVAIPEDKEWLSDIDSYVRKQLEVFCATEEDVAAAREDRKYPISVGQVGIRCIHCSIAQGNNAIGHAIAYPFSISGIYESVKEFHRLHLDSCPNLPATSKAKLQSMKGASSLSSVLRKYYTLAAKALGLVDTRDGIRTGGESTPIGSLAAFTFSETEDASPVKSKDGSEDERKPSATRSPDARSSQRKNDEEFDESTASRLSGKKRSESSATSDPLESKQKHAKLDP